MGDIGIFAFTTDKAKVEREGTLLRHLDDDGVAAIAVVAASRLDRYDVAALHGMPDILST